MAERMGMNVGQIVFLTELIQPICDAIRMHTLSVILSEDITGVNPPVSVE